MKDSIIINLTPHNVALYDKEDCEEIRKGNYVTLTPKEGVSPWEIFPASGTVARATEKRDVVRHISIKGRSFEIARKCYSKPEGLPEPQPDTLFLVSALTAQAVPERDDLLIVEGAFRDAEGKICGCTAFAVI